MHFLENNKILIIAIVLFIFIIAILIANIIAIVFNGKSVPAPEIPREKITIGVGKQLNYLILGDSTTIAQGARYENGYVVGTATKLSEKYKVTYQNFGVSGAVINDVLTDQLTRSRDFIPDLVVIAAGANDVTHLTSLKKIERDTVAIIDSLRSKNPNVKIIFTGSAAMGSVKRFLQPVRWIAGLRTNRINTVMERVAINNVAFAYIARETKEKFADNPQYFAEDNFHPNDKGYAEWTKVLNPVLEKAIIKL
jgi:acyl-CoA thioesterase I